jgi:hypothetical protein
MLQTARPSARVTFDKGVALVVVEPCVMTGARLRNMRTEVVGECGGEAPLAYICDFSRVVWAVSEEELNGIVTPDVPATLAPAAMVVPKVSLPLFRAHSMTVALRHGVFRKALIGMPEALAWCQRILMRNQALSAPRTAPGWPRP